ncbi:MAG TPA: hypothetical protein VHR72_05135, partial [Gemmataceae bacterium]|nr:hypothetical protein [Gemmataceae bacterium]
MMTHAKKLVKDVLYRIAPRWTTEWMSARSRAHSHKVVKEWGCPELNRKLIERFGDRVQEGPFAGTILTAMAAAEQLGPFLLGVYESELDSAWEVIRRGNYAQVVDIGAKFGYYAVGMARWFPRTRVVTFDTDWWARDAVREMAKANGVSERIDIRGYCDRAWLVNELQEAAF